MSQSDSDLLGQEKVRLYGVRWERLKELAEVRQLNLRLHQLSTGGGVKPQGHAFQLGQQEAPLVVLVVSPQSRRKMARDLDLFLVVSHLELRRFELSEQ